MAADMIVREPSGQDLGADQASSRKVELLWLVAGAATIIFAGVLAVMSRDFSLDIEMTERPILAVVAVLVFANAAAAIFLPILVLRCGGLTDERTRRIVWLIVLCGLVARLMLFGSQPILENDYQRYLWDGGVTAHGSNPYELSPATILRDGASGALAPMLENGGQTLERIGHKHLTSIYPPVAQATFAIAHLIAPWNLDAWRLVLLAGDLATLILLLKLLDIAGRSRLWVSLYWLNPLVLKEAFNSAHMEPILVPFVIGSLMLAWQRRSTLAAAALALAAGIKIWPLIIAPVVLRIFETESVSQKIARLILPVTLLCIGAALSIVPMVLTGSGESSGLIAYAESWKTNSALYPALETLMATVLRAPDAGTNAAAIGTRTLIGAIVLAVALSAAWRPWRTLHELVARTSIVVAALVLLSPAQYPWYALWFAPFFVFHPSPAFRALMVTVPLYYTSFYFAAHDRHEIFTGYVVWLIWIPVWIAAASEFTSSYRQAEAAPES
jgi:hypothetical protein